MNNEVSVWLGGNDITREGNWEWADGTQGKL